MATRLSLGVLAFIVSASAHGHDHGGVSRIADGATVSAEPLVSRSARHARCWYTDTKCGIGHNHVDPYLHPANSVRGRLPFWHGPWSKLFVFVASSVPDVAHMLISLFNRSASLAGTYRLRSSAPLSPSLASSLAMPTPAGNSSAIMPTPPLLGSSNYCLSHRSSSGCT